MCATCTTTLGTYLPSFVFDLVITDVTDGNATGTFHGTSSNTGIEIFSNSSSVNVAWAPLQLGPGGNNATTGSFGSTIFTNTIYTGIVAPNSGTPPGQSTIQGTVDSTPELATFSLIGGALLGFGMMRRKIFRRP